MLTPIALFSHANKVVLKILHSRLQDYVNQECPDVQAEFRKGRGNRDQSANICWIIEKAREFQKSIYLCFIDCTKSLLLNHKTTTTTTKRKQLCKALKRDGNTRPSYLSLRNLYASQEATVRNLMEQLIGSRMRKEYDRAVCCHPVCLTYMLSTS